MRILAIDTATSTASAALVENGKLVAEQCYPANPSANALISKRNHAEIIVPLIDSVLSAACVKVSDLSAFAISVGPGSFTGLRIGLSTVQGLAYGLEIPIIGVSTLLATAARVTNFDGSVCSFLDARKGQVYAALFRWSAGHLARLTEDTVVSVTEVIDLVRGRPGLGTLMFIGSGATPHEKLLTDEFGDQITVIAGDGYPSVASAIGRLGGEQFGLAAAPAVNALVPIYLRPADAQVKPMESR
jgi:tRNA threonylcarbamoyladenosine biosynthesis protein TsaB